MSKVTKSVEAASVKAPAIAKRDKTILKSGLTYSLCSRVQNALPFELRKKFDNAKSEDKIAFVDGRGADREVHKDVVAIAEKLGAKFIASVRSSFLKPRMNIDWEKLTVEMVEPEAKAPAKAEVVTEAKAS